MGFGALMLLVAVFFIWLLSSSDFGLRPVGRPRGGRFSEVDLIRDVAFGRVEALEDELEQGADPNVVDDAGNSPLACAGPAGHAEVVSLLLEAGGDVDTVSREGETLVLIDAGADPNQRAGWYVPLHAAAGSGSGAVVELLLEAGAVLPAESPRAFEIAEAASRSELAAHIRDLKA